MRVNFDQSMDFIGLNRALIDSYLAHLHTIAPYLHPEDKHLAVDGQFAKKKWLDGVETVGLHTSASCAGMPTCAFFIADRCALRAQGDRKPTMARSIGRIYPVSIMSPSKRASTSNPGFKPRFAYSSRKRL
ncbi:MAG: hypothetical protein ACI906_003659 [Candidatus Latescibacterota bacterium]|jgi:hypothetical protein